jgi:hypothetical protein
VLGVSGLDPKESWALRLVALTQIRAGTARGDLCESRRRSGVSPSAKDTPTNGFGAAGVRRDRPVALSVRHAPELDHRDCSRRTFPRHPLQQQQQQQEDQVQDQQPPEAPTPDHGTRCSHRGRRPAALGQDCRICPSPVFLVSRKTRSDLASQRVHYWSATLNGRRARDRCKRRRHIPL